jgi:hypothetical protein
MRVAARFFSCWLLVTVAGGIASRPGAPAPGPLAWAAPGWKDELEQVCSKTDDAMSLTSDELRSLVSRCDQLKQPIAGLEESERKVYSRRLQLCRDLYDFVLQSRERR